MRAIRTKTGGICYACPGCKHNHYIPVSGPKAWAFNDDLEKPTLNPSVVEWSDGYVDEDGKFGDFRCHHFLREGRIEFLSDCSHDLKNQTVELSSIPEKWLDPKTAELYGFLL